MSDKLEKIKFSGIAEKESGELTRHNYFKFLRNNLDDYSDLEFTPEQAHRVHAHLQRMSTGSSAMVPMYCGGAEVCPFANRCIFNEIGQVPIGRQCLVEIQLIHQWVQDYMNEFDVNPQNFTEVAYCNELAEIMILDRRLDMNIAKPENCELITDATVGVDREGDAIVQKQISPFVELKDKLSARRSKIIKLMVGDRQEKYKKEAALKIKLDSDPSGKMASVRNTLEGLSRNMDQLEEEAKEGGQKVVLSPEDIINDSSE